MNDIAARIAVRAHKGKTKLFLSHAAMAPSTRTHYQFTCVDLISHCWVAQNVSVQNVSSGIELYAMNSMLYTGSVSCKIQTHMIHVFNAAHAYFCATTCGHLISVGIELDAHWSGPCIELAIRTL